MKYIIPSEITNLAETEASRVLECGFRRARNFLWTLSWDSLLKGPAGLHSERGSWRKASTGPSPRPQSRGTAAPNKPRILLHRTPLGTEPSHPHVQNCDTGDIDFTFWPMGPESLFLRTSCHPHKANSTARSGRCRRISLKFNYFCPTMLRALLGAM